MSDISNIQFSHDFIKFVYQQNDMPVVNPSGKVPKPFHLEPPENSKKTKKDQKKEKHDP